MHICGLEAFFNTLKMKKIGKKHDKGELSKANKNAEIQFASRGFAPPETPTRALPWTLRGLGSPLDPWPKWCRSLDISAHVNFGP